MPTGVEIHLRRTTFLPTKHFICPILNEQLKKCGTCTYIIVCDESFTFTDAFLNRDRLGFFKCISIRAKHLFLCQCLLARI